MIRFTTNQKELMKLEYINGKTLEEIGNKFNTSKQAIKYILNKNFTIKCRSSWEHLIKPANHTKFSTLNHESSYWIGFLMADGSIVETKRSPVLGLTLSEVDENHVKKFKDFLESSHTILFIKPKNSPSKPSYRFSVKSKQLTTDLIKWGVTPKKTFTAKVHEDLILNRDFWRGVIDGDGSLRLHSTYTRKDGTSRLYPFIDLAGSQFLMEQYLQFIKTIVPECKAQVRPIKSIYRVQIGGASAYRIIKILYNNDHVALDRKKKLALEIIKYCEENEQNVDESK